MSAHSAALAVRTRPAVLSGAGAGIAAAAVMGLFAMVAGATYHGVGFFTPMYHIASSLIGPETMMESAAAAQAGQTFNFVPAAAVLGMLLHVAVGATFGALFAAVARAVGARGAGSLLLGITFGGAVLVIMSFVGLPIAATLFGGGDPIRDMPQIAGWWTFGIEHVLFGTVLGLWYWRRTTET